MVASISDQAVAQVHIKNDMMSNEGAYTKKELVVLRDYIVEKCNELEKVIPHDDLCLQIRSTSQNPIPNTVTATAMISMISPTLNGTLLVRQRRRIL